MTEKKQTFKQRVYDKMLQKQMHQQIKEIAFLMPIKDRKKFEKACDTEEKIFIEIMQAGIPRERLETMLVAIMKKQALIKKHKNKLKLKNKR